MKRLDGFSFHIGFRPTQIGTSPNQADDGHPSLCPQDHTEQRVAAELRTADDKLMTTPVVVGGLIPYEPDIVDQYFEKIEMRRINPRLGRFESRFSPLQLSLALQHKSVSRQLSLPLDDNADEVPSVALLHF